MIETMATPVFTTLYRKQRHSNYSLDRSSTKAQFSLVLEKKRQQKKQLSHSTYTSRNDMTKKSFVSNRASLVCILI